MIETRGDNFKALRLSFLCCKSPQTVRLDLWSPSHPSLPCHKTLSGPAVASGPADMYSVFAWILGCLPLSLGVSVETDPMTSLENITGKLVFYQMEGNATYVRDTELASDVPTEAMFQLFDPPKTLSTATFTYTWDFGNGEVIQGTEPVVRYHYSESGNYTLRLSVGANVTQTLITGVYSMDVTVLDAIKNIELKGPASYEVSQDTSLAFHVDGSPPMWICWRFLPNCMSVSPVGCTLTMLYGNTLRLDHTFTSAGVHCLDISARNDISKLTTSYSLYVRRNFSSNIFFILPCVAIFVATFSFITAMACRSCHHNNPQIVVSTNAIFLTNQGFEGPSNIQFSFSTAERDESQPLLLHCGTHYSS